MDPLIIVILSIIGLGFLQAAICGLLGINAPKEPEDETEYNSLDFFEDNSIEDGDNYDHEVTLEVAGQYDYGHGHYNENYPYDK